MQNKKIIDWIFGDNERIILGSKKLGVYEYNKQDLTYFFEKGLSFNLLSELYNLQMFISQFYRQDRVQFLKIYKDYKNICDENGLNIDDFFDLQRFLEENEQQQTKNKKGCTRGFIYIIRSGGFYKIGRTINLKKRIGKYITENPNDIEVIHFFEDKNCIEKEKFLHNKFSNKNHNREWFNIDDQDILFLKSL